MRITGVIAVVSMVLGFTGLAGAQTLDATGRGSGTGIVALEAQAQAQDAQLAQQVQRVSAVGSELQEAQVRVDGAVARSRELAQQTGSLEGDLENQQRRFESSKARYKEQAQAAYKGDNLEGLVALLDGVLNVRGDEALSQGQVKRILSQNRRSVDEYRGSRRKLENTVRQVNQKRADYGDALKEERERAKELNQKEERLEATISRLGADKRQTDSRIQQLQRRERVRILGTRPATAAGEPSVQRRREMEVARGSIVARPVEKISKKQYRKLYRRSAKKYGFGKDWYILAAVGKVESNHGQNMGPSTAGAMGPMQFLPSTWEASGVDGNGDGTANIMDPRDAIPAAAKYLKAGGAPQDWYAALYSYNHADWYVKKVLGVAEGYRQMKKDDRVGPYI